jgi:hypothetical protein
MGQSCDFALRPVPVVTNVGHLCAKGRNLDQCRIARKRQDIDEIHPVTVRGRKTHHRDVVGIKGIKPDRDFLTQKRLPMAAGAPCGPRVDHIAAGQLTPLVSTRHGTPIAGGRGSANTHVPRRRSTFGAVSQICSANW